MGYRWPFRSSGLAAPASLQVVNLEGTYGKISYPFRTLGTVTAFIVHHSDGPTPTSEQDALTEIERIHQFHKKIRDWPGFAYNGAVWRNIYYRCRPATRMGWHSAGTDQNQNGIGDWNEKGYAVVFLGDYGQTAPSQQMLDTMLAAKALEEREVFQRVLQLRGHQSGWPTTCPGNWWPAWSAAHGGV